MNIGNLGKPGGIDRSADRSARTDGKRSDTPSRTGAADQAAISANGRDAAAQLEARIAAAKQEPSDRAERVVQAIRKLASGGLDTPEVHRDVAARMLDSDFFTA
jgi:hypothetical protein